MNSRKTRGATEPLRFSNEESFGLFMEGVRSLQLYDDEAARDEPKPATLDHALSEALQALEQCEKIYPNDLMPLYNLGIALTVKNQQEYAALIRERNPRTEQLAPSTSELINLESVIIQLSGSTVAPIPPNLPADVQETASRWRTGGSEFQLDSAKQAFRDAVERFQAATWLPRVASRAWPLLDRAAEIFEKVLQHASSDLFDSTAINLANVYAKRDDRGDLKHAEELLHRITSPATNTVDPWWRGVQRAVFPDGNPRANVQQRLAIYWKAQLLLTLVVGLQQIRLDSADTTQILAGFSKFEEEVLRRRGYPLPEVVRADLVAEYWLKVGYLDYELSFASFDPNDAKPPDEQRLRDAEIGLKNALQIKKNWNPALVYLAQVYQARAAFSEAARCISRVLGDSSIASQGVEGQK